MITEPEFEYYIRKRNRKEKKINLKFPRWVPNTNRSEIHYSWTLYVRILHRFHSTAWQVLTFSVPGTWLPGLGRCLPRGETPLRPPEVRGIPSSLVKEDLPRLVHSSFHMGSNLTFSATWKTGSTVHTLQTFKEPSDPWMPDQRCLAREITAYVRIISN